MDYCKALTAMSEGKKVAREHWNGKGMFIFTIAGGDWDFSTDVEGVDDLYTLPFICIKTADNKLVPWLCSRTDAMSTDWIIVEDN